MISVDIILIAYNQEQYIRQAIESVLNQKVNDMIRLRLLVADDMSTDATLSIIKSYDDLVDIPFVYLEKANNVGYIQNYKQAFEACNSDYVAIIEGDDYWLDNHIEQHIVFLEEHMDCSMSMNNITRFDKSKGKVCNWNEKVGPVEYVDIAKQLGQGNQLGNLSACVFRCRLLKLLPVSFYCLNIADWELGAFMAQYGLIAILRESTSVYRISSSGQWAGLNRRERERSLIRDLKAMDYFFEGKYHSYCVKYYLKIKMPYLRKFLRWLKRSK